MQDNFQENESNKISGLFEFLNEHYKDIRPVLMLICDRAENGIIANLFPRGIIATKIKPIIPKLRALIERLDKTV